MNLLRNRIASFAIVAIGAVAWLAVSNHCALAAIEGAAKMPMLSCHGPVPANHSPAKHDQNGGVECCKVLRATLRHMSRGLIAFSNGTLDPRALTPLLFASCSGAFSLTLLRFL